MKTVLQGLRASSPWAWLLLTLTLVTCSPRPSSLVRVNTTGALTVATTNSPTTCYDGATGPAGYECELLQGLAKSMGVRLELRFLPSREAVLEAVASGRVDLGAAGLDIAMTDEALLRHTRPIQSVQQQHVFNGARQRPGDPGELRGRLVVPAGSSALPRLNELRARYPSLSWEESAEDSEEDLLNQVASGDLDYTIANSDLIAVDQRYLPQLRVAFDISDTRDLAWALPPGKDASLFKLVDQYLAGLGENELDRIRDRYFGSASDADYQGVVRFVNDVQKRLPRFRPHFESAASRYGLDWQLLAAVGYQESKWDEDAISPTGVRGIMMLTMQTATHMAVSDREDPVQSIDGGARYLQHILEQLPESIHEPDRSWMALAAYNQGLGHLEDARVLAEKNGKNPNHWVDVREMLPLLSRERWFTQTRHGYARGREAVVFVANVRSYYDLLTWMSGGRAGPLAPNTAESDAVKSADARPAGRSAGARQ